MVTHCLKDGWSLTACGLEPAGKVVSGKVNLINCANCCRILETASPAQGWAKVSPALRAFYFQRAGFAPETAVKLSRKAIMRWPESDRSKIVRQLQSNPNAARAMGLPVKPVERGGSGDARRKHAADWLNYQLRKHGHSCPHCGGVV